MPVTQILALLLVGAVAGVASGLFGIGGGLIMVPIFLHLLHMETHRATATSLAVVVLPVALPAVLTLYRAGNIDLKVVVWVALGFAVASVLGARINLSLDTQTLNRLFAILLVYSAVQLWFKPPKRTAPPPPPAPEQVQNAG